MRSRELQPARPIDCNMSLPLPQPFSPMEALSLETVPIGKEWRYEPKWDGFRCLAFRDGRNVALQSKSGHAMTRYYPEIGRGSRTAQAKAVRAGRRNRRPAR